MCTEVLCTGTNNQAHAFPNYQTRRFRSEGPGLYLCNIISNKLLMRHQLESD